MDTRQLTQPLALTLPLGEQYLPPAFFYAIPRTDDYFSTIAAMLLDDQVVASLQLRKHRALTAFPVKWSDATPAAARTLLDEQLARLTIEHDLLDGLACIEQGFAPCEQVWVQAGGRWWIERIQIRDPRRFRFHRDGRLLMQTPGMEWVEVPPMRLAVYTHQASAENPYGVAALEACYPRWQGKWKTLAQLERLGEKYSIPPVVALTDATDDTELTKISSALAMLESGVGVALAGVRELIQLKVSGSAADLLAEVHEHDAAISRVLTSQSLASNKSDTGSYAMAETHMDSLDAIALLDFKALLRKFSRTSLAWVLELNGVAGPGELIFDRATWEAEQRAKAGGQGASQGGGAGLALADPGPNLSLWA